MYVSYKVLLYYRGTCTSVPDMHSPSAKPTTVIDLNYQLRLLNSSVLIRCTCSIPFVRTHVCTHVCKDEYIMFCANTSFRT